MNISLELIKKEEKGILKNLGELYIYELSQYSPMDVNNLGLYDDLDDLDNYWKKKIGILILLKLIIN